MEAENTERGGPERRGEGLKVRRWAECVRKGPLGLRSPFQIQGSIAHTGLAKKNRNPQEGHDLRICF